MTNTLSLNKSQQRELNKTLACMPALGSDYAARSLSALYRSAMRDSQRREILSIAVAYKLTSNTEFII
jgi:hypothetical protein